MLCSLFNKSLRPCCHNCWNLSCFIACIIIGLICSLSILMCQFYPCLLWHLDEWTFSGVLLLEMEKLDICSWVDHGGLLGGLSLHTLLWIAALSLLGGIIGTNLRMNELLASMSSGTGIIRIQSLLSSDLPISTSHDVTLKKEVSFCLATKIDWSRMSKYKLILLELFWILMFFRSQDSLATILLYMAYVAMNLPYSVLQF